MRAVVPAAAAMPHDPRPKRQEVQHSGFVVRGDSIQSHEFLCHSGLPDTAPKTNVEPQLRRRRSPRQAAPVGAARLVNVWEGALVDSEITSVAEAAQAHRG